MPSARTEAPPAAAFTAAERRLIARCRTPLAVQRYLNALPYNNEPPPLGRDAAQLPRRRAAWHGPLPRGGAGRRGDPRAARAAAAGPELRVDRRPRSRDLRVPPARPVGLDRALARSRPARPPARVRDPARAGPQLCRSVRRSLRPRHRPTPSSTCGCSGVTTGGSPTPTSGKWSACCSTTRTGASAPRTPLRDAAQEVPRLQAGVPRPQAGRLRATGAMDRCCRRSGRAWRGRWRNGGNGRETVRRVRRGSRVRWVLVPRFFVTAVGSTVRFRRSS